MAGRRSRTVSPDTSKDRWPAVLDAALVERMIPLVQRAIVDATCLDDQAAADDLIALSAPDVANVLLMILATIMEPAPECATPRGTRLMTEEAARELARLIADVKRLKAADVPTMSNLH